MQIKWTKRARIQLYKAFEYIEEQDPIAAFQQIKRVKNIISFLEDFPELGVIENISLRKLIVPKTKYIVRYKIHSNHISILSIIHQSMK